MGEAPVGRTWIHFWEETKYHPLSLAPIQCFLPPVSLLILLIYLKELRKRRGLWLGVGGARGLRHPTPTPASQRSHPARTKSHFPTNSLSEAAGQVINHGERERRREGGRLAKGGRGRGGGGRVRGADGGARGRVRAAGRGAGEGETNGKGGKEIKETKRGKHEGG